MVTTAGPALRIAALAGLVVVSVPSAVLSQRTAGGVRPIPSAAAPAVCGLAALPGLTRHLHRAIHDSRPGAADHVTEAAALAPGPAADFERVARAVLGEGAAALVVAAAAPDGAVGAPSALSLPCSAAARQRDLAAWHLALGGYSARAIADVLEGHLTTGELDEAHRRLMAGQPRTVVAAFLERRWREAAPPALMRLAPRPPSAPWPGLGALDRDLVDLSRAHGVAPGLVRAVVAAESAGRARAVSPAGAIGLMQLMPATAAALGVNPWAPRDNLRGGIAYLAALLRAFDDDARLALIAYNAGPQHARDVRAGRAVAYRETRRYLDAVHRRYPLATP